MSRIYGYARISTPKQNIERQVRNIRSQYPEKVNKIAKLMRTLSEGEKKQNQDIDYMAGLFGSIMGEILVVREDEWQDELRAMGNNLGKFIYLLDAYEDIEEDLKEGRYNPLKKCYQNPDFEEEIKTILTMVMAACCKEFEKLPIIENAEILRNILYSGIWYRYEVVRQKRQNGQGENGQGAENA